MQPFRMSGAVSGHQSARQRQAEQIISRDGEGKGKRGKERTGKTRERGSAGTERRERPRRCVFNIRLMRITQTGLCAVQSRNPSRPPSVLQSASFL